jgi:hypothetical protein
MASELIATRPESSDLLSIDEWQVVFSLVARMFAGGEGTLPPGYPELAAFMISGLISTGNFTELAIKQ